MFSITPLIQSEPALSKAEGKGCGVAIILPFGKDSAELAEVLRINCFSTNGFFFLPFDLVDGKLICSCADDIFRLYEIFV